MRKTRDYDAELRALSDKAKSIKAKKIEQLGLLVTATGADALDADVLAGALLDALAMKDAATREGWRKAGAAFFRGKERKPAPRSEREPDGALPLNGGAASH